MTILVVTHRTIYRYARPVSFGEHRLMMRPRDSHDLRLIDTVLTLSPPARIRWFHDVFNNSIAVAEFSAASNRLYVESEFRAQHYPVTEQALVLEPYARTYPFAYTDEDRADLGRTLDLHSVDPRYVTYGWARRFLKTHKERDTLALLAALTRRVHKEFAYVRREEMGTQDPITTLRLGAGSCRDFALFMMEAARTLGFAARFVSGYLYDEALIDDAADGRSLLGGGATHAWVQIYLPGAGWVEYDPTNALIGGRNLIRVAVTRDASQAVPVSGTYVGSRADYLGMDVTVEVRAEGVEAPVTA